MDMNDRAILKASSRDLAVKKSLANLVRAPNVIAEKERGVYEICGIRMYSRVLTRKERLHNYQIDECRF